MSGTVQTPFTCINLFHLYKNCMRYVPLLPPILHIKKLRHNFKRRIKIWGFKSEESSYRVYSYNHYITISKDIQILIKKKKWKLSAGSSCLAIKLVLATQVTSLQPLSGRSLFSFSQPWMPLFGVWQACVPHMTCLCPFSLPIK